VSDLQSLLMATAEPPRGKPWDEWFYVTRLALVDLLERQGDRQRASQLRAAEPERHYRELAGEQIALDSLTLWAIGKPQHVSIAWGNPQAGNECRVTTWHLEPGVRSSFPPPPGKVGETTRLTLRLLDPAGGKVEGVVRTSTGPHPIRLPSEYQARRNCRLRVLGLFTTERIPLPTGEVEAVALIRADAPFSEEQPGAV
jgi:hypothetical protein